MNADHVGQSYHYAGSADSLPVQFFFLEADDLANEPRQVSLGSEDEVDATKKRKELYNGLLRDFAELPKSSQNTSHGDYGVVNVAPSVVPNPYLPSFRIFTYNTTGSPYNPGHLGEEEQLVPRDGNRKLSTQRLDDVESPRCDLRGNMTIEACRPSRNWHSSPQSPSRTNRLWTLLGYAQVSLAPALHVHDLTGAKVLSADARRQRREAPTKVQAGVSDTCGVEPASSSPGGGGKVPLSYTP